MLKGKRPQFQCYDDYHRFEIADTYAYVNLAYQVHNFQSDRTPPDVDEVRDARSILDSAIKELQRDDEDLDYDRAKGCFDHEQTKRWIVRINSHLRLAEAVLR